MKKLALLAAFLCVVATVGFAQGTYAKDGMLVAPGSLIANAGVSFNYGYGFGLGGGVEYSIGKFVLAEKLPFSYGAAARLGLYLSSGVSVSAGVLGTLHFSWAALDLPSTLAWVKNIDTYIGLGLSVLPSISFNSIAGSSYFLSKSLAVNFESGLSATYIGVLYKF